MNEHKRWETILVHPADSKPYNKSLVKALFIIKGQQLYNSKDCMKILEETEQNYSRYNITVSLPVLNNFAPLVAMLGPPLGPSIDMMSMASTLSSAVAE
ncbi:hypothetical protein NC653_014616 [Populus alba x Populus x berolinensis]|uniref:Uncharacterized protein n=1 Tax=Populus alba x Populus x berolinensis TaxID=444605 RepID=A0AAD6W406_9ROSI|nr:hypothetical protein NC653_014616 [Populus alba x Populus x berolinensis]